ncbi:MAG: RNA-binding domain-containing protein [Chloroflexota bacterium]
MNRKTRRSHMQWKRIDLHIHTPASNDYQEEGVTYLDILKTAEQRGVDIVAITDHNTVGGYAGMLAEIAELELLEGLDRIQPLEKRRLDDYRKLSDKLLILPGFEFTATLGFHILAVFSPEKSVREIEYLLLSLRVPAEEMERGGSTVGATSDVTTAYKTIRDAGGIVIAAHANSAHGVAMRGFNIGGQTKIAYTQDPNLHALEVTDLDKRGRYTTARFFDGRKPEYPRPMRCIQGSDAHRLSQSTRNRKHLGVGDRITEVLLPEVSFEALKEVFEGNDFSRTRPFRGSRTPVDFVKSAQEEGASIVQSFHVSAARQGGKLYSVVADVCAFANTNGGTIYIGVSADARAKPKGVSKPRDAAADLQREVERRILPMIEIQADVQETRGASVVRLIVPRGSEPPYAIDENKIYVRDESETNLAVRDEIVALVTRSHPQYQVVPTAEPLPEVQTVPEPEKVEAIEGVAAPRTGVEIIASEKRRGIQFHSMRDLRNNNVVKNVTRKSARKLWHYAITQREDHPVDASRIDWHHGMALMGSGKRQGVWRYDLAQKQDNQVRVFYGVTEDGMSDEWLSLLPADRRESSD